MSPVIERSFKGRGEGRENSKQNSFVLGIVTLSFFLAEGPFIKMSLDAIFILSL